MLRRSPKQSDPGCEDGRDFAVVLLGRQYDTKSGLRTPRHKSGSEESKDNLSVFMAPYKFGVSLAL